MHVSVFTFDAAPERRRIRRFHFIYEHFLWRTSIHWAIRMRNAKKNAKIPKPFIMLKMVRSHSFIALLSGLSALSPKCCPAEATPTSFAKKKNPATFTFTIIEILFIPRRNNKLCNLQKCLARGVCYLWDKCSLMLC